MATNIKHILLLVLFCSSALASDYGLWECSESYLESNELCVFNRTDGKLAGPHNFDNSDDPIQFKKIVDIDGNLKPLTDEAFEICDVALTTTEEQSGNELQFVKLFTLMAPIRDLAMFSPGSLQQWETVTKVLDDCEIKQKSNLEGSDDEIFYSSVDIKKLMQKPVKEDIHNHILKYLEEAQNQLLCMMTDTGAWNSKGECNQIREDKELAEGQLAKCWEREYEKHLSYDFEWAEIVLDGQCFQAVEDADADGNTGSELQAPSHEQTIAEEFNLKNQNQTDGEEPLNLKNLENREIIPEGGSGEGYDNSNVREDKEHFLSEAAQIKEDREVKDVDGYIHSDDIEHHASIYGNIQDRPADPPIAFVQKRNRKFLK